MKIPMLPASTQSVQEMVLDGPIGLPWALVLGLAIGLVFAGWLWREVSVLGPRQAVVFWLLRMLAAGVVLWMLLAPAAVRTDVTTTRRSIAILQDVSGSMQTVDPLDSGDALRWNMTSTDASPLHTALAVLDRSVATLGIAERRLRTAAAVFQEHRSDQQVIDHVLSAQAALERTGALLQDLPSVPSAPWLATEINAARLRLEASELEAFQRLCGALRRNAVPEDRHWRESLSDQAERVAAVRLTMLGLVRRMATIDPETPGLTASPVDATRQIRVQHWLEHTEASVLQTLAKQVDVRRGSFATAIDWTAATPATLPTTATGTDLHTVLEQLRQEHQRQPLSAVFLLTDAAHNRASDETPATTAAQMKDLPVYVLPIGNSRPVRDLKLRSVFAPSVALRNDDLVIDVRVEADACAGETCLARLLQDGQVLDQRELNLDGEYVSRSLRFERHLPEVGLQTFQLELVPLEGEASEQNNRRTVEVQVTRSEIQILLADERPRWETRYLMQLFRRDPKVACDELLFRPRMVATGQRAQSPRLPETVEEWDHYDVVLLGDLPSERLPRTVQTSLVEYVEKRGGTLIVLAGDESMPQHYVDFPLQVLLPIDLTVAQPIELSRSYQFRLTEQGRQHPALMIGESDDETRVAWDFVNQSSPLSHVSAWRRPLATARTLLSAVPDGDQVPAGVDESSALLCWQPVGRGRVVYLASSEIFRLRFLRGDRLHARFWGQMLRWAIASELADGSKFVRFRTDQSQYEEREPIQISLRLRDREDRPLIDDHLSVRLTDGTQERTLPFVSDAESPGDYSAVIPGLTPGTYRLVSQGAALEQMRQAEGLDPVLLQITVVPSISTELTETRCNRVLAQQIAEATGGQVLAPAAFEEILALTDLEPVRSESTERRPLWVRWKYLWIVFGCLQLEWMLRKRQGLS